MGWSQKPEWLKMDPNGHSLFVQGLLNDREDTTHVLQGTISIYPTDRPKEMYTFKMVKGHSQFLNTDMIQFLYHFKNFSGLNKT